MPFVEITLTEGRSPEQLRTLITRLTDATETSLGATRDTIRVVVQRPLEAEPSSCPARRAEQRRQPP